MSAYDILFEEVAIGPLKARNRFYQVPHCCGYGHLRPQAHAAMRGMKAEGGWAVVSTEETEIHPSSDLSPYIEQRIWDEKDVKMLCLMTEKVHSYGSLAAIELVYNGHHASNLFSRIAPMGPSARMADTPYPKQARAMDKQDIKNVRKWHRDAAVRAMNAGFDIIYVYAGHHMSLPHHFMQKNINHRLDEYGGSLENRVRLTRELLEETKEAVGQKCAVAFRFAVDDCMGNAGIEWQHEGKEIVEMLSEIPDLWDVNVAGWENDSATARFQQEEAYQNPYISFVKSVTTKPVVAVGRITSPDLMVDMVKKGIVDFIGAARPSISDPFLPHKIQKGHIEEIRECIGCNICVASDSLTVPIRCTQNPTMGEEWRRGWHPEYIPPKKSSKHVLIIGGGVSGLECALQLGLRGYKVTVAEKSPHYGGRALYESRLCGLQSYKRVIDYRLTKLQQLANVQLFKESELSREDIETLQPDHIFVATGSSWQRNGVGRSHAKALKMHDTVTVITPDDVMQNPDRFYDGKIVIFDDEHGYMGSVIAEHLGQKHHDIAFITSAATIAPFAHYTLEEEMIQKSLMDKKIEVFLQHYPFEIGERRIHYRHIYETISDSHFIECDYLVLITQRVSHDHVAQVLKNAMPTSIIGDAYAPALIADAVYSGYFAAYYFEESQDVVDKSFYRREMPSLETF